MLLACYTPYTFSSDIFGPIAPSKMNISIALEKWLNKKVLTAMDPNLNKLIEAQSEDQKIARLLTYFQDIYAAKSYTEFSPRQELVLQTICDGFSAISPKLYDFPSDPYPEWASNYELRKQYGDSCKYHDPNRFLLSELPQLSKLLPPSLEYLLFCENKEREAFL